MKLEVGMYVRTKWGYICKLININEFREPTMRYGVEADYLKDIMFIGDEDILKASYNIIKLIKERDFVKVRIDGIFINWFMVDLFEDENENQELGIGCYEDGLLNSISEYRPLNTLEILEVVTKEQFESMSYRIEDEK